MELTNYRRFNHASVELGDGIIGILGQNGTGKSTFVEAIAWAIYGNETSILRNGKEGVKRSGALPSEECQVVLEFDLEGDVYRLVRSMRGRSSLSDAALLVNGKVLAKGDRAVTETMIKRLGMDHKAFFTSVFARQKELNSLSVLRPADRKKLVLRMLGIDVLDDVVEEISKDAGSLKGTLEALSSTLVNLNGRAKVEALREEVAEMSSKKVAIRNDLLHIEDSLKVLEGEVEAASKHMEVVEARSAAHRELESKRTSLTSDLRNLGSRKERALKEISTLDEKARTLSALGDVEARATELERRKEALEEVRAKHSKAMALEASMMSRSAQLPVLREELKRLEGEALAIGTPERTVAAAEEAIEGYRMAESAQKEKANMCAEEAKRLLDEIRSREERAEKVRSLGPESECPTCERKLGDHHHLLLKKMTAEIEAMRAQVASLMEEKLAAEEMARRSAERRAKSDERRRNALKEKDLQVRLRAEAEAKRSMILSIEEEVARAAKERAELGKIEFDQVEYESVKAALMDIRPKVDACIRLRTEISRRPSIERELEEMDRKISSISEELSSITKKLEELSFDPAELSTSRAAYSRLRDIKDNKAKKASDLREELSRTDGAIGSALARIYELEADAKRLEEVRARHMEMNVLLNVMKDFRTNVMARVVPTLSRNASELFNDLTDGRFGGIELDEDYEVFIYDGGEKYPLSRFSGGESDLANLSLRLAISRMIAERSGRHVDLLVLDEIFGSQDNIRKRNILDMLNKLQRQFAQIFVITHIEDVKDAVDDLIVVREAGDGCSQIGRVG
ncbi:MAG: SMC family ATPase [Methanomassiliicoccales archaeon]|nr:MAG: SMC family ATPase [Methanomassiliicoccales archaeon]